MGKAVDEHDVLDLISTESDDELDDTSHLGARRRPGAT